MASVTAREGFETPAYALWKYRYSALKIGTHYTRYEPAERTTQWTLKDILKWFHSMPKVLNVVCVYSRSSVSVFLLLLVIIPG